MPLRMSATSRRLFASRTRGLPQAICSLLSATLCAVGRRLSDKLLLLVALFGIVLAQAPKLLPNGTSFKVVLLVPFLLGICATSAEVIRPRFSLSKSAVVALWVYLSVLIVTMARGVESGASTETTRSTALFCAQFVLLAWFSYRLLASAQTDEQRWERLVALALAPATFVAFNLLIMKVHLPFITVPTQATGSANGTNATFLNALGIHASRSNLPLTGGVNASGAMSATGFAAAAILALRVRHPSRLITVTAAGVCAYAALLSDSHTVMIIALGVVVLFAVRPRFRAFSWVPVATSVAPAIVLASVGVVASLGFGFIGRGGTQNLETLDDRVYIWRAAWNTIIHSDLYHILVGYGAYGQVSSGASRGYAWIFEGSTEAPLRNTVHDLAFQTMLDGGIVALAALVLLGVAAFTALSRVAARAPSPPIQALSAILVVLLLNGATEALPSYLFAETLDTVLLVAGAALALAPYVVVEPGRKRVRSRLLRTATVSTVRAAPSRQG
jgi:O-antigen ligase